MENFLNHTCFIHKDKVITSFELELNHFVFSLLGTFYQQLQGAAMGSPLSPVIVNIYIKYFEEIALYPQCLMPIPWWKRYLEDIIIILKKEQVDTLFNHLNSVDPHIKFTMEAPGKYGSISILDTKCSLNSDYITHTSA